MRIYLYREMAVPVTFSAKNARTMEMFLQYNLTGGVYFRKVVLRTIIMIRIH